VSKPQQVVSKLSKRDIRKIQVLMKFYSMSEVGGRKRRCTPFEQAINEMAYKLVMELAKSINNGGQPNAE
jgi:hypothetical protein